jgi:hypothetical protein
MFYRPKCNFSSHLLLGSSVRETALRAARAVRPLQLGRCIPASKHLATRNFHIYRKVLLKLRIGNLQKLSLSVSEFRENRHRKSGDFLMRVNEASDRMAF